MINMLTCLQRIMLWIEAALELSKFGMPARAFTLVVELTNEGASEVWEVFKYAAALYEARRTHERLSLGSSIPARTPIPRYEEIWSCPENFPEIVRDIIEGKSVVKIDGDVGELWDPEVFLFTRRTWLPEQWDSDWESNVIYHQFTKKIPWSAFNRYYISRTVVRGERSSNATQPGM
jgi:hypothetical protein